MSVASSPPATSAHRAEPHEPAWEIARLFPAQGAWTEEAYLSFTESMNQFCELVDGRVEVPDTPSKTHQQIVHALLALFLAYLRPQRRGEAIAAPYRVRLRSGGFREPDITVYRTDHPDHLNRFGERFGDVPDLVVEVVSDDPASRIRDYEDKRREYAAAGIAEYWIIDPATNRVLVLTLDSGDYVTAADQHLNEAVTSRLFPDFTATIADLLPTS
jgi:Uma2 family endonuclease